MGYLITPSNNFPIEKVTIKIPAFDIATIGTIPVNLVPANTGITYVLISAFFEVTNQSIPYSGFSHIYLTDQATLQWGIIEMASVGGVLVTGTYAFALNMTNPPNRFGARIAATKPIDLAFNVDPIAGDGDFLVTLYYLPYK
jgi:hypothetical protein